MSKPSGKQRVYWNVKLQFHVDCIEGKSQKSLFLIKRIQQLWGDMAAGSERRLVHRTLRHINSYVFLLDTICRQFADVAKSLFFIHIFLKCSGFKQHVCQKLHKFLQHKFEGSQEGKLKGFLFLFFVFW